MRPGQFIRGVACFLGWGMVLVTALLAAVLLIRPTVPLGVLTPRVERALTDSLGLPVTLSNVTCRLALAPTLAVGSLEVGETGPDAAGHFTARAFRFTTSLPALGAGTVRIRDATAASIEVTMPGTAAVPGADGPPSPANAAGGRAAGLPLLDVAGIRVDRVCVRIPAGHGVETVDLTDLVAEAPQVGSCRMSFHAAWRTRQAEISLQGGHLNTLLRGARLWPLRLEAMTDAGSLEASLLARGAPLPRESAFEVTAVLRDASLAGFPSDGAALSTERVAVRLRWEGLAASDMADSLDVRVLVDGTRLLLSGPADGEPLVARLHHGVATRRPGQSIAFSGNGELAGEPLDLDAEVGPVAGWPPARPLPFEVRAEGAGARLRAGGSWGSGNDLPGLQVTAELRGDRIGDLHPWLGFSADCGLPYRAAVSYERLQGGVRAELTELRIGSTRVTGHAGRGAAGGDGPVPELQLDFDRLDLVELSGIGGSGGPLDVDPGGEAHAAARIQLDIPVLPAKTRLPDADVFLRVGALNTGRLPLANVATRLRFREGWLERSPFSFETAGAAWDGECFLDARGAAPVFGVEVSAQDVAVDDLIKELGDDPDLTIKAGRVVARAEVEGSTLREMLESNTLALLVGDAHVRWPRPGGAEPAIFDVPSLGITRHGRGEGLLVEASFTAAGETVRLASRLQPGERSASGGPTRLEIDGTLATSRSELALKGGLRLPLRDGDVDMTFDFKTGNPAWLTDLAGLEWTPVPPVEARGRVKGRARAYEISDLDVKLNHSRLAGRAVIDATGPILRWRVEGRSPELRLEDLGMVIQGTCQTAAAAGEEPAAATGGETGRGGTVAGELALDLERVSFDGQDLGGGAFGLSVEPGRVAVQPLRLASGESYGDVSFAWASPPGAGTNLYQIGAVATNLPIRLLGLLSGEFARSRGVLYADAQVMSAVPDGDPRLAAHVNGEFGFAVFPENIRSRFLDYWAVGAMQALGMSLAGQGESKVQCIAGRLVIEDGMAKPRNVYIDTSRMRVHCTGWVDFNTGKLHLKMKPRPKGRAFVNLATPVEVKGTLDDPEVQVTKKALAGTALRVYFWFVTAMDSLFKKQIPAYDFEGYMRMMSGEKP